MPSVAIFGTVVVLLWMTLVSAVPVRRQSTELRVGWISNDYAGTVWTKQTADNSSAGVYIGISAINDETPLPTQLFAFWDYVDENGNTLYYLLQEVETDNYLATIRTADSDHWALGFQVLQTVSSEADAMQFTTTAGSDDGSLFDSIWTPTPTGLLSYYIYQSTSDPWVPVIMIETTPTSSQSWTFHDY
ncbi:hypothetical protein CALCODRAFT_507906 [Calocera cornea HHB12733]|uniref:DUF5077 domain-containing protein n=1 Tax=Calocera cornea HHB12733 TaxID=1353952 RepID=A0A165H1I3_9BASI|nr:hypothetical protein CALCODRAFT_507906 [Calocera cornea HHB12733]